MAEDRRYVEVPDDVAGEPLECVEQHAHVELPRLIGADVFVERRELRVIEGPVPIGPVHRMVDRDEVHRSDQPVGAHCLDDVLGIGPGARIVVDLGADRVAHSAPQAFRDHLGVPDVDVGRLGSTVEVAGLGQFERAPHQIHRRRILERQRIHMVGDHHEARVAPAARVIKPQEQHASREGKRAFLGIRLVFAFGVSVNIGDSCHARVAFGVHETGVLSENFPSRPPPSWGQEQKKSRLTISRRQGFLLRELPGLGLDCVELLRSAFGRSARCRVSVYRYPPRSEHLQSS